MKQLSRVRVQWIHDTATEFLNTKLNMTMNPEDMLQLTTALLEGMAQEPVVPETVSNRDELRGIPDRIWLNTAGEWPADGTEGEVTWCRDQQHELDTMYVRAEPWIPCGERMPENYRDVHVYCSDTREQFVAYREANGDFRFASHEDAAIVCTPSHWQPLPAPPKDGV